MEGGEQVGSTVCVTGASGFVGSWLVMRLLQRGYYVRATVRDPGDEKKVKHLLELPRADTHLSLWKADLVDEGSFDEAIRGCTGVFHVAANMDFFSVKDPENDMIKPTVNGVLNVMKACCKAKTVKRFVHTSSTVTVTFQEHPPAEYDESCWTDVEWCKSQKMTGWVYFVSKTLAEKAAWKFAEENGINLVAIQPPIILGPFITPTRPAIADLCLALLTKNEAWYPLLFQAPAMHLDDLCSAEIFLFEHPQPKGRYVCCSHVFTIYEVAKSLALKYPDCNIPTEFEGADESVKVIPYSSKKLMDLGFEFKYKPDNCSLGDLFSEAIETCKAKGLMPL